MLSFYSQNQEVKGTLTIASTTSIEKNGNGKFGEGARLYLRGTDNGALMMSDLPNM